MSDALIPKPVKLLVAHMNPDLDAIGAAWLFMRFDARDFERVSYYFVNAGDQIETDVLAAKGIDEDEVVHVDTGMGPFDHHQPDNARRDSATLRVHEYLMEKFSDLKQDQALTRVVNFINESDHFASFWWPEPIDDRYLFMLEEVLGGLRSAKHFTDHELLEFGMICLDGVYTSMKIRVSAEEDLDRLAWDFDSPWGKGLAIENQNDEVLKLAQKRGYVLVVRKDKERKHVRIKAAPDKGIDLTEVYETLLAKDRQGTWYLHQSRAMLLNGSRKHSGQKATELSLREVVEIVQMSNRANDQ